jgi:ATP-dependent Clp endopeptidase proteolytic subunit ClpP
MQSLNPKKQEEKQEEELLGPPVIMLPTEEPKITMRTIGLIGDVDEEKAGELIYGMLALKEYGKIPDEEQTKGKGKKQLYEPFEFYLSTHGGSASDMFAIYDVMRQVKKSCEIHTIGIGKVMSAGVLLLAAGTKGKRKIGKHCRVMIHSVLGGSEGPLFNIQNEFEEIKFVQEAYSKALTQETNLTPKTMKELLEQHVNIYLSAEEAVKYGIADEVF